MHFFNYIDGRLQESRDTLPVYNPTEGVIYADVPNSSEEDLIKAIESAKEAQVSWGALSISQRREWLEKLALAIKDKFELFARAETIDTGKPLWLSQKVDIPRSIANLKFFAGLLEGFASESYETSISLSLTLREPIGIAGVISPWNLPLYLLTWKIAPALATGNCVIAKPSELTPYTSYLLAECAIEIGLPKGVLNILHGKGESIGRLIVKHEEIKGISFTGSSVVGREIAQLAAKDLKKISLEMGGKNPLIIYNDADLSLAVKQSVRASFLNQGEICLCGSRIYIEDSIYNEFKERYLKEVATFKVGDPFDGDTKVGALISKEHRDKVLSFIQRAKEDGGKILFGGDVAKISGKCGGGYFIEPTVIEGLSNSSIVNQEEIFGPVVTLNSFSSFEDSIEYANDCRYGLSAAIWTKDINKALQSAKAIKAGIIWINGWLVRDLRTPFGGVKDSGYGREGGFSALRFFTEEKNICIVY